MCIHTEKKYVLLDLNCWQSIFQQNENQAWFTHLQAILGVYDIFLSDEYNQRYIKKMS